MIIGTVIMVLSLVPPPLLLIIGVISDSQFLQISNSGYVAAGVGAALFIIGIIIGVFGQGAHTEEHAHTTPDASTR
jgi:hypothetical protein